MRPPASWRMSCVVPAVSMQGPSLLLRRLAEAGVEFVVVGGFAGTLHGSSLLTNDIDVCTALSAENVERLRRALADLSPVHRQTPGRLSFLEHPPTGVEVRNLYLETSAGILDVLSSIPGVGDVERLKARAITIPLYGQPVALISLEDLIAAKESLGREKDLLAAKELRAIAAKRAT